MVTAVSTKALAPVDTGHATHTPEPWMSVRAAALAIGRSEEYLYAGLRDKRFPGARFGRAWSIPACFIRTFVTDVLVRGLSVEFEDYARSWSAQRPAAGPAAPPAPEPNDSGRS